MSFFENSNGVDAKNGIFNGVGRDQMNIQHQTNIYRSNEPDIHALLDPIDGATYNRGQLYGSIPKFQQGTRKDVIAEIGGFVEGNDDRRICWLSGPPGSGKSAISQTVAEQYATDQRLAASFFFFRGAGNQSKMTSFIPTLAYEISISVPDTKPFIQNVMRTDPSIAQRSLAHQFDKLMIEPILAVRHSDTTAVKPMIIVIDAIDECDDKEYIRIFVKVVIDACARHRELPFRFLFTSRVEEHIREALDTDTAGSVAHRLDLQNFDACPDIQTFLKSEFSTIYNRHYRHTKSVQLPWPSKSDLATLVRNCNGSFIFAVNMIKFINNGLPHRKIQQALEVNDYLDHLYYQILSVAPHDDNFRPIIGTIALLNSPVPITFLAHLLQLVTEDILHALRGVQSILTIPEDDYQPILLFHPSLRDFLVTQSRSRDFFIDPTTCHLSIAMACLKVLKVQPEHGNVYGGGKEYACLNWCYHLYQGLSRGEGDVLGLFSESLVSCIVNVTSPSRDCWINTIISEGGLPQTLDHLKRILQRLKQILNCPRKLTEGLETIERRAKNACSMDAHGSIPNDVTRDSSVHGDEPVRKSLVAMCTQNMVRVYCQSNTGDIKEYSSVDSPVDLAHKLLRQEALAVGGLALRYSPTCGPFRRSIPASGLGGVVRKFTDDVLRLYMQEPNSFVIELCGYTVEWDEGWMEPCNAIAGSSIAAVGDRVPPISVYYQGLDKAIYEKKDTGVWQDVRQLVCDAKALTAISAVSLKNMDEIRLYYQDNNYKIRERRFAAGSWTDGFEFPIEAPPTTSIASVSCNDGSEIRLYIQDSTNHIVEWCYDEGHGWRSTEFRQAAWSGTDIAATATMIERVSLIWLFYHGVHDVLQGRTYYEIDERAVWTDAQDVFSTNGA